VTHVAVMASSEGSLPGDGSRAPDKPPAPIEFRRALRIIDGAVDDYITRARIRLAT
jgi:hypothetical protein